MQKYLIFYLFSANTCRSTDFHPVCVCEKDYVSIVKVSVAQESAETERLTMQTVQQSMQ